MRSWGPDISAAEAIMSAFIKDVPAPPRRRDRIGERRAGGKL
jgi:hypothetical protein